MDWSTAGRPRATCAQLVRANPRLLHAAGLPTRARALRTIGADHAGALRFYETVFLQQQKIINRLKTEKERCKCCSLD